MPFAWSSCVVDSQGVVVEAIDADRVEPTASIGKIFLLCEAAELIVEGRLDPTRPLLRDPALDVADSGLWQHLRTAELPVADVCQLIAAVSDNWATNVLLEVVGMDAAEARTRALGCQRSGLLDRVRTVRTEQDPHALSMGTARELAEVARRIHAAAAGSPVAGISGPAAHLVEQWLLTGVDLSMVAAPFRLDPLSHMPNRIGLWSKTGCDRRVRADMGTIWAGDTCLSYAAMATWAAEDDVADEPYEWMHDLGRALAARVRGSTQ
ncbi:MAG: serine hydrolase [bacterium]